jgi:hypothetical protein
MKRKEFSLSCLVGQHQNIIEQLAPKCSSSGLAISKENLKVVWVKLSWETRQFEQKITFSMKRKESSSSSLVGHHQNIIEQIAPKFRSTVLFLMGENQKVVWIEFSTFSYSV